MEFAGLRLSDLLSLFAVVINKEEESLDLFLGLLVLLLDLVSVLDFPLAVERVVGGCVTKDCRVWGRSSVGVGGRWNKVPVWYYPVFAMGLGVGTESGPRMSGISLFRLRGEDSENIIF